MSLRTSAHTGAAIRVPAAMPGKSVVLRANSQLFRIRREELLFGLCCRRSYGLPRRFAPRNDMQKLAACPHNTWALPVYCRKASLQPLTPARLQHVIANHVLATEATSLPSACHCEPVRTLAWQSVLLAVVHGKSQHLRQIRNHPRIRLKCCFFLAFSAGKRIATSLRSSQ